jgi:hypothetical protein
LAADGFGKGFVLEGGDLSLKTPPGKTNGSDAQLLLAYPDAFAAEDTLVGIVGEEGTALVYGEISFEFFESFRLEFDTKMFSYFLEFAQTVL